MELLLKSFDLSLMLSIIVLSYAIFRCFKAFNIKWCTNVERIITLIMSAGLGIAYHFLINVSWEQIIPTYLVSVVFYDYFIKIIVNKIKSVQITDNPIEIGGILSDSKPSPRKLRN